MLPSSFGFRASRRRSCRTTRNQSPRSPPCLSWLHTDWSPSNAGVRFSRPGCSYVLGRDSDSDLAVNWDPHISRRHAQLTVNNGRLLVEKLSSARNAIYLNGQDSARFSLDDGDRFVIGADDFLVRADRRVAASPTAGPVEEVTFDRQELKKRCAALPGRRSAF